MDELARNVERLKQLVDSGQYTRIAVYARSGEGKTRLIEELKKVMGNHHLWNIFSYEECTIDSIEAPYVLSIVDPFNTTFDDRPDKAPEVYFLLKYSDEYKKKMTGIKETLGPNATMRDYLKHAKLNADEAVFHGPKILYGTDSLIDAYRDAGHSPT